MRKVTIIRGSLIASADGVPWRWNVLYGRASPVLGVGDALLADFSAPGAANAVQARLDAMALNDPS